MATRNFRRFFVREASTMDDGQGKQELKNGRRAVPRSRRLVLDILRFADTIPTCTQVRPMDLSALRDTRSRLPDRISWPAIFIKAWAAVSVRHPRLLQSWRRFPWPHLYQHTEPTASLSVARRYRDDDWLFWGKIHSPQRRTLSDIQQRLNRLTTAPIETTFRRQLKFVALPGFLRRCLWWWNLHVTGDKRARRIGTFLLTTVAGRGAETQHPPTLHTSCISYSPLDERGISRVRFIYDHRVMDGSFVAGRLVELESELQGPILSELESLSGKKLAKAA